MGQFLRNFEGSTDLQFLMKNERMFEPPGHKPASYGAEFSRQNIHRPLEIYGPCAYAQNIPPFSLPQIFRIFIPFLSTIPRLQRSEHKCPSQHNALNNVLLPPLLPSCILISFFSHLMTHAKERCLIAHCSVGAL